MAGNDVTILQTSLNTCMPEIKDVAKLFWYLFAIIAVSESTQDLKECVAAITVL